MTTGEAIDTLAKRWKALSGIGLILVGIIVFVLKVNSYGSDIDTLKQGDTTQNEMIQSNNILIKQMAIRIENIDNNLAMILKLWGIDSSRVNRWRRIPAEPHVDTTTGFPSIGSEWLRKSLDSQRGWLYRATEDSIGTMLIETVELWDLTKK